MRIINDSKQLQVFLQKQRRSKKSIGFVPTMGSLHEGHLSLARKCRRENDVTVLSIFVNPAQFGPKEDFRSYPRQKKKDILLAKKENIDIIFYPSIKELYPNRYLTYISVEKIADVLCGKFRPGHFRGVATIVGKLLNIVTPDVLYLGGKDAQQCVVIKQMVRDLNLSVKIKVLPTVREKDGLALSSRNRYLTKKQRNEATILYQSLKQALSDIKSGQRNTAKVKEKIRRSVHQNSSARLQYVECVNADTLEPAKRLKGKILIALAAKFGKSRLIDNVTLTVKNK